MREAGWAGTIDDQPWSMRILGIGCVIGLLAILAGIYLLVAVWSVFAALVAVSVLVVVLIEPMKRTLHWMFGPQLKGPGPGG
jgi:hypothetical protein